MTKIKPEPVHWIDSAHGVYIPQAFAQSLGNDGRRKSVMNVSDEEWAVLDAGPDHEYYWDVWSDVEHNAEVVFPDNMTYRLHQDGDLWLIPHGMEWDHNEDWFVWPKEERYDERI
jgi:hypothetical protein